MDWDDVRYFLALARTGSARAAGASVGVSHSTITRRVDAFETQLGTRLFDRHRDGYMLTDAGRQMVPRAERIEVEMAALERAAVGRDASLQGEIRLTCTDPYVGCVLMRAGRAGGRASRDRTPTRHRKP
ncbi:MAG: LysR family transcriptional regulator [Myxococcota bacterium]